MVEEIQEGVEDNVKKNHKKLKKNLYSFTVGWLSFVDRTETLQLGTAIDNAVYEYKNYSLSNRRL